MTTPYLELNDFGVEHTQRVLDIAKRNFSIKEELQELTFASIILHDVGGSSIKEQYEKGPPIATAILKKLRCTTLFVGQVCKNIITHHEHPDNPSEDFKILFDSDKLVMFSHEEYPHYNSKEGFDWDKIITLMYSKKAKQLAEEMLAQRRKEQDR